jgi:hypothetical protein
MVGRVYLNPHLRHDFLFGGKLGQFPHFKQVVREGFLPVNVLTQFHCAHAHDGVHMVRRRNVH